MRVLTPGWAFRLGLQCWKEEPLHRAVKPAETASERGRGCSAPAIPLEGPRFWLTQELAHSGLQHKNRAGRCQGHVGGTTLIRCRLQAEGQPSEQHSLGTEMLVGSTVPIAPPPPIWRLRVAPNLCSKSLASSASTAWLTPTLPTQLSLPARAISSGISTQVVCLSSCCGFS